jgi:hypothetical protein
MRRILPERRALGFQSRRGAMIMGAVALLAVTAWCGPAQAANLVQNGNFELSSIAGSYQFGTGGSSGYSPVDQVTDWTTGGYNFVFQSGTGATTGATGQYGNIQLWGPGNGSSNGLPASSPAGGNFIAADGAYEVDAISQTIVGLIPGAVATLTFYWAGAQQQGYTGATTEQWEVSLGGQTLYTPVVNNTSEGFTGWMKETMTFTPTSSSEVLAFTAIGTPSGVPPMVLLDGLSLTDVPEPATWALLVSFLTSFIFYARWRRKPAGAGFASLAG